MHGGRSAPFRAGAHTCGARDAGQAFLLLGALPRDRPLHRIVNEELGEVPCDGISQNAPPLGLDFSSTSTAGGHGPHSQILLERMERDMRASRELYDPLVTPWLLRLN